MSATERAELFALLDAHFEGVSEAQFARDLDEKDWVLRVRRGERLVGFSTVQIATSTFQSERMNVVYSGDTIMRPEAWGSPVLARAWIAMIRRLQGDLVDEPWYWLLLSSGYRTYRFLPVFWREFWPRHETESAPATVALLSHLARERYGSRFIETEGIVRFDVPQRLKSELAAVPDGKRGDAHVEFFLSRNPGHAEGDELVCLTELGNGNLTAAGARMLRGTMHLVRP
ncbi:MAG: hypothetical protein ABIZ91_03140 [Gemmatimonadaceae bacterium]